MLAAIDEMKTLHLLYAAVLAVVQSSGLGKSKAVYRIALDRIVIPICLRADDAPDTFCEFVKFQSFGCMLITSI